MQFFIPVKKRTELDRMSDRKVTGVFSGSYAVNPFTGDKIPVWISEYVLAGYGMSSVRMITFFPPIVCST